MRLTLFAIRIVVEAAARYARLMNCLPIAVFLVLVSISENLCAAVRVVSTVADLHAAVSAAAASDEIVLQPGIYRLESTLDLRRPRLVLRGATGQECRCVN